MAGQFSKQGRREGWRGGLERKAFSRNVAVGYGGWLVKRFGGLIDRGRPAEQGRWAYHPPPWRCWLGAAACLLGMALGAETGAQTGSAPFVFEGGVLRIGTPGWESDATYLVDAPAYVEVADGVDAHMRGNIGAAFGSPNGLYKLGGGTLRLSGVNSYRGGTRLLQGGLHVDGSFGTWGGIEAIRGTRLEYSPGVDVSRPLTFSGARIAELLPPSLYGPAAPVEGMENAVGWKVAAGEAVQSGLLQGGAPFVKLGAGLLNITGDAMAYTGEARVAQGALAINEIFSGSVSVGAGAWLQGAGSVAAVHVEAGGTLAPGNAGAMASGRQAVGVFSMAGGGGESPLAGGADAGPQGLGMLSVVGDVRFDAGSRFEVEAAASGESDFVWAGGKALLDGEVAVLAGNGLWRAGTSYAILSARGGFDDTEFASVSSDLAFLTPSLAYAEDTVTLTLTRNDLSLDEVGETPDEKEAGRIIEEDAPRSDPEVMKPPGELADHGDAEEIPPKANPDLNESIAGLNEEDARQALRQLTGSWNASVSSGVWDDSRFLREAVLRKAMGVVALQASSMQVPSMQASSVQVPRSPSELVPWVEMFHSDQVRAGRDGMPGDTRRLDGLVLGIAAAVSASWNAGAYLGAQRGRLVREAGAARADVDTTHAGLHLAGHVAGLRLALGAARSWHRVKSSRFVRAGSMRDVLDARYGGHTVQVFGEAAWPLFGDVSSSNWTQSSSTVPRVGVTPFARLSWIRSELGGFAETGGPAALNVQPSSMTGWISTVGIRAETSVQASFAGMAPGTGTGAGTLYAQLAWHRAGPASAESTQSFRDSATQTRFTSQGLSPVRQSWSLQVGLDARVGKTTDIGFAYQGRFGRGLRDQGMGGWVRIAF